MIVWSLPGWPRASFFPLRAMNHGIAAISITVRWWEGAPGKTEVVNSSSTPLAATTLPTSALMCVYSHTSQIVTDEAAHEPHAAPDAWLGFLHNRPISLWFKHSRPICHKHRRCGVPVSESHHWKRINTLATDSSVFVQSLWTVVLGLVRVKIWVL